MNIKYVKKTPFSCSKPPTFKALHKTEKKRGDRAVKSSLKGRKGDQYLAATNEA